MNRDRHAAIGSLPGTSHLVKRLLRSTCHAFNNRVNKLQVTRIWRKRDLQVYNGPFSQDGFSTEVVFDITGVAEAKAVSERNSLLVFHMSKFSEDSSIVFLKQMLEHVQASPMPHTYTHLTYSNSNPPPTTPSPPTHHTLHPFHT